MRMLIAAALIAASVAPASAYVARHPYAAGRYAHGGGVAHPYAAYRVARGAAVGAAVVGAAATGAYYGGYTQPYYDSGYGTNYSTGYSNTGYNNTGYNNNTGYSGGRPTYDQAWHLCTDALNQSRIPKDNAGARQAAGAGCMQRFGYRL